MRRGPGATGSADAKGRGEEGGGKSPLSLLTSEIVLVCEDPLEGLRWMDEDRGTVGLENDACQPQGPNSLQLTMRLEDSETIRPFSR